MLMTAFRKQVAKYREPLETCVTVGGNLGVLSTKHVVEILDCLDKNPRWTQTEIHESFVTRQVPKRPSSSRVSVICDLLEEHNWVERTRAKEYALTAEGKRMLRMAREVESASSERAPALATRDARQATQKTPASSAAPLGRKPGTKTRTPSKGRFDAEPTPGLR